MPDFNDAISASINISANVAGAGNVKALGTDIDALNVNTKESAAAFRDWSKATTDHGAALGNLGGQLRTVAAQFLSVYAAVRLITDAFKAASGFDQMLDKLAVSSGKTGAAFQQASEGIHQLVLGLSQGTIFSEDKVLGGLTKFRDAGFDVFSMTKEQLQPVLDAATATMQDLGDVADATAVTLRQFNLNLEDTGHVANLMYEAFKLAGTTAEGFQQQITAAGAAAATAGVSLESYLAVTTRLKQLGFSDAQAAQFQKLFFSAGEAPSAKQLQGMRDAGVDFYRTPASFQGDIDREHAFTAAGGVGPTRAGLFEQQKQQASAFDDARTKLLALQDAEDKNNVAIASYSELADTLKSRISALSDEQDGWKEKLDATKQAITATTDELAKTKTQLEQLSDPQITGMSAFDSQIEKAQLAAQKQELANLRLTQQTEDFKTALAGTTDEMGNHESASERLVRQYGEMGDAAAKARGHVKDLEKELADLRNEELKGEEAFSDTSFKIGQQIKELQLRKVNLSPADLFGGNQLDKEIARLTREKEQVDLRDSLQFDPAKRAIQKAANAADIAAGRKLGPDTAQNILAGIQGVTGQLGAKKQGDDTLKSLQDEVQALQLEKAVQFGNQVFQIKERAKELKEQLGLVAEEQPFGKIMAELPTVAHQYGDLSSKLAALKTARDAEQGQVDTYDAQIKGNQKTLETYTGKIDDLKKANEQLKPAIASAEEQIGGMTKPLKDEAALIDELKNSAMGAGAAYDFLGKRGGAMMVALLGDKGQNLGILERIRDTLKTATGAATGAADVNNDVYGAMEKVAAATKNLEIELGTSLAGSMTGLMGAVVQLTNAILTSPLLHPIKALQDGAVAGSGLDTATNVLTGGLAGYIARRVAEKNIGERAQLVPRFASGGIVPGSGWGDTVPAMLTPGEEVIPRSDPRHRMNGGGVVVNVHGDVHVRNDADIDRLATKISEKLHHEYRRVASGMPA